MKRLLIAVFRVIVRIRYKWEISGLKEIKQKGSEKILFLPNHPAFIDPLLLMLLLYDDFKPRSLADEYQINRPVVRTFVKAFGIRTLPNLERGEIRDAEKTNEVLKTVINDLNNGDNLFLYPAGHLKRGRFEEIGAGSAVYSIIKNVKDLRIVLIRQNGLWGSSLSFGFTGKPPVFFKIFINAIKSIFINFIFFIPKRRIKYEFEEPSDFPFNAAKLEINAYLEKFYNKEAWKNTYVAYSFFEKEKLKELPEPSVYQIKGDSGCVSGNTRTIVYDYLKKLSGKEVFSDETLLSKELGLDSLSIIDLLVFIEKEFGFSLNTPQALKTVGDVLLTAAGQGISALDIEINKPSQKWFCTVPDKEYLNVPGGKVIPEVILKQARKHLNYAVLSDQSAGTKTFRDILITADILKNIIKDFRGEYIGILLPASVVSSIIYTGCLFAGKIPVMINWTMGIRNITHAVKLLNIQKIITSELLIEKLKNSGTDLIALQELLFFAEKLKSQISLFQKISSFFRVLFHVNDYVKRKPDDTAVVLFTSGSESTPKAVPLSHENILTNIRDIVTIAKLLPSDSLLGMLPPFHSFGLTINLIMPLCIFLRTLYHTNPTESLMLASLINEYRISTITATPTFLSGIMRAAKENELSSLKYVFSGAEKCPLGLYDTVSVMYPSLKIIEGYGITECSPVVSLNSFSDPLKNSIGSVLPSVQYVIINPESEKIVKKGEKGILLVKGKSIFKGYLKYDGVSPFMSYENETWYKTGDLVKENHQNILFFEGRLKRFIKLGGEMISLPAIESALIENLTSEINNDGPVLAIEASGNTESPEIVLFTVINIERAEANEILKNAGLSPLNNIRKVIKIDSIPVLGTGKTDYQSLKKMLK